MYEEEFRPVHHVHGHELAGLDAILQHELRVATCLRVRFGPCVAAGAAPDGFVVGWEAADLGFELVPEGRAFALCCVCVNWWSWESRSSGGGFYLSSRARAGWRVGRAGR
jgi:hypothetical protein